MSSEDKDVREYVHILLAFRRRKDNPDGPVKCCRELITDEPVDLERLKLRLKRYPGTWRIHKTVNKRNVKTASNVLLHKLIDDRVSQPFPLMTSWKSILLTEKCRGERRFLLDVDDRSVLGELYSILDKLERRQRFLIHQTKNTPGGGLHIVCDPFDTRIINHLTASGQVTILRDGYIFVEKFIAY